MRERRAKAIGLVAASIGSGFAQSAILALIAEAAAAMVANKHRVSAQLGPISYNGPVSRVLFAAIGLACLQVLLQALIAYLPSAISAEVLRSLQNQLIRAYVDTSWETQANEPEGQLQDLMTNQATQASYAVLYSANLITGALTFVVLVVSAMVINIPVALIVMGSAGGLFLCLRPLAKLQRQQSQLLSQEQLAYASGISEAVRLDEETQVFGVSNALKKRIGDAVNTTARLFFRTTLLTRTVQGTYQAFVILLLVGALAGVYAAGIGHIASLGALVLVLVRASMVGQQAQADLHGLHHTLPFVDRLEQRITSYTAVPSIDGTRTLEEIRTLAVEGVSFAYTRRAPVIVDMTFQVQSGELIAIVGPSGAGKSTLVRLLLRLCQPDQGLYLVNDVPADAYSRSSWTQRIAYLPQEPRLMRGTISDNIRYYRDVSDSEVERCGRLAHIHDEVMSLEKGYDTIIGPRAETLSMGQSQRVCLARALAGEPDLLILDEPTSALDPQSEVFIQQALADLRGNMTVFVVAHRLSILSVCDRVMVLGEGRLQSIGAPTETTIANTFLRESLAIGEPAPASLPS